MPDGLNEVVHDGFRVGIYLSILLRNMSYICRRAGRYYAIIHDTRTARLCNTFTGMRGGVATGRLEGNPTKGMRGGGATGGVEGKLRWTKVGGRWQTG